MLKFVKIVLMHFCLKNSDNFKKEKYPYSLRLKVTDVLFLDTFYDNEKKCIKYHLKKNIKY